MAMIQVIFWVVTLCSDVIGYHHFGEESCCLHLQKSQLRRPQLAFVLCFHRHSLDWIFKRM